MEKVKITIVLIFSFFSIYSQEYFPFPTAQAIWNHNVVNFEYSPYISYKYRYGVIGDTIINSNQYFKVYQLEGLELDITEAEYVGAYREVDKKIYALFGEFSENEMLIYDFNLEIGDFFDYPMYGEMEVLNVDTIELLDGTIRKKIELSGDAWIEGIGSLSGLFAPIDPQPLNYTSTNLKCFYQNETSIYINDYLSSLDCDECFCALDIDSYDTNSFKIFPNPFFNELNFKTGLYTDFRVRIYDSKGQLIKEISNFKSNRINLSELSCGIYFLELMDNEKTILRQIIKE
jgi:hypothetical protein